MPNGSKMHYVFALTLGFVSSLNSVSGVAQPALPPPEKSNFELPVDSKSGSVHPSTVRQVEELQASSQEVKLSYKELCKTEQGRQLILNSEDPINLRDKEFQWQGLRANGQASESTFDEYRKSELNKRCSNKPADYEFIIGLGQPLGPCSNTKFGPPHYDVEATVKKIQEVDNYYRTSKEPWAGGSEAERRENLKKA